MTKNGKKVLIIEDNLEYAVRAAYVAQQRGYEYEVVFDLALAQFCIQSNKYDGIITDMQFCKHGINAQSNDPKEILHFFKEELEKATKTAKTLAFDITGLLEEYIPMMIETASTDSTLNDAIIRAGSPYVGKLSRLKHSDLNTDYYDEKKWRGVLTGEEYSVLTTPLGYHVINNATCPVSVVSSLGHGERGLVAAIASGITTVDELSNILHGEKTIVPECMTREQIRRYFSDNVIGSCSRIFQWLPGKESSVDFDDCTDDFAKADPDCDQSDGRELVHKFPAHVYGLIGEKVIFPLYEKNIGHYHLAFDQIEGKINQTRPYTVAQAQPTQKTLFQRIFG